MGRLGIIGGTGIAELNGLRISPRQRRTTTPYGEPSADPVFGSMHGREVVFLARHGNPHRIPPHKINYRANLWALRDADVSNIVAIAAVGGIRDDMVPRSLAIPDQIIDYTYGRHHTFFEDALGEVVHIDFTQPYSEHLRARLVASAKSAGINVIEGGVYGATQGPRLETIAEIARMERDGCAMVGMTGMPEAALARELELGYACCGVIANWAAGKSEGAITLAEIHDNLRHAMQDVALLLQRLLSD